MSKHQGCAITEYGYGGVQRTLCEWFAIELSELFA
jgi:hypothetical protein